MGINLNLGVNPLQGFREVTGLDAAKKKRQRQEAAAVAAMSEAAKKQQLDLMASSQAAVQAQVELQARAAAEAQREASSEATPADVQVSLTDADKSAPATTVARKRRKQFFNDGYSPGVSL